MVRLENVTKKFPTKSGYKIVLNNVSIQFPTDRSIGIIGRNGTGKSTLVKILAGSMMPNTGHVRRLVRLSWPMGFMGGFPGSATARDTIRFVARIYGEDWRIILKRVEDFAELGEYIDMPVSSYSSGMRSRLSVGLSYSFDFDCYLMDEILGVGDARFRQRSDALFQEKIGKSHIMLVSHSPQQLRKYCKSGAVLHDGGLHYFDDINDALKYYGDLYSMDVSAGDDEP